MLDTPPGQEQQQFSVLEKDSDRSQSDRASALHIRLIRLIAPCCVTDDTCSLKRGMRLDVCVLEERLESGRREGKFDNVKSHARSAQVCEMGRVRSNRSLKRPWMSGPTEFASIGPLKLYIGTPAVYHQDSDSGCSPLQLTPFPCGKMQINNRKQSLVLSRCGSKLDQIYDTLAKARSAFGIQERSGRMISDSIVLTSLPYRLSA